MLNELGTTLSELDEYQKRFLKDVEQGVHGEREYKNFKFDERTTKKLPGRVTMGRYLRGESEPSQRTAEAIVEFYNRSCGKHIKAEEFSGRRLDEKALPRELLSLVGNYYCLFPEPDLLAGKYREAKGAFLCVKQEGTQERPVLSVHMAAEIRSEALLFDPRLPGVFAADDVETAFDKLFGNLTDEERHKFTYYKGSIALAPDLETVCIDLTGRNRKTWSIRMNMGNSVNHLRLNPEKDRVHYRYGMGLAWMEHDQRRGFCLTKFALIAQRCMAGKKLSFRDPKILEQLSLLDMSKLAGRRMDSILLGGVCADEEMEIKWYQFATNKWGSG